MFFFVYFCGMRGISLQHLSIGYGNGKVVAEDLNALAIAGELICLLGPNGVGKSTLLKTLAGFLPSLHGSVVMSDGRKLSQYSRQEQAKEISIVLTERPDVRNMTVEEVVGLGRTPYTGFWGTLSADDKEIVKEAIETMALTALSGRSFGSLSDGERQKVMIAKALAQQTSVIILDEPTAFLDYPSKIGMMQVLRVLAHEHQKSVLLSTHDVELALRFSDTLWLLADGDSLITGHPDEMRENKSLAQFLGEDLL